MTLITYTYPKCGCTVTFQSHITWSMNDGEHIGTGNGHVYRVILNGTWHAELNGEPLPVPSKNQKQMAEELMIACEIHFDMTTRKHVHNV